MFKLKFTFTHREIYTPPHTYPHEYRDIHIYTYTYKQTHTPTQMTTSISDLECLN